MIREATRADIDEISAVINDAASAYRGVIPDDRWHDPYMSIAALASELDAGIRFSCYTEGGTILGVMGIQDRGAVVLIRHAYVRTTGRRQGVGAQLLKNLLQEVEKPVLIGTWKAAKWAIRFYEKYGFRVLPEFQAQALLRKYWNVPPRQMETSVVLADPRYLTQTAPAHE